MLAEQARVSEATASRVLNDKPRVSPDTRQRVLAALDVLRLTVGKSVLPAGQPVKISYTYRTLVRAGGHLLHLRMGKPTHGVRIEVDHTGSGITSCGDTDRNQ